MLMLSNSPARHFRAGYEGLYDAIDTAAGPVGEDNEKGVTI
jgi:hypothetical protein